jgi:hypothetical protein
VAVVPLCTYIHPQFVKLSHQFTRLIANACQFFQCTRREPPPLPVPPFVPTPLAEVVALTSAWEPPPTCPLSPTPSDTPTYQDIDAREPTPPVSPASSTSTLGENEYNNVPNWEAIDFEEGDFSHVKENHNDEQEATFYGFPIDADCTQVYIDLIYRHPTFFPDLHTGFPDLLEYPPFTTMTWVDWELLHQICRCQEAKAREEALARSHREWVKFLEQNGEPVLDHLQAGPSQPQEGSAQHRQPSLYAKSDLLSNYDHDRLSSSSSYYTPASHLSSEHPSAGITPAASCSGDFEEETEVEAPRPAPST